jgi:hypothetical protein
LASVPYVALLALAQTAAGEAPGVTPSDFQLKPAPARTRITPDRCPEARAGEIVVCARRGQGNRLAPLVPPPGIEKEKQSPGIDIGGGRLGPSVTEVAMPNGRVSKRITIDFKLPF